MAIQVMPYMQVLALKLHPGAYAMSMERECRVGNMEGAMHVLSAVSPAGARGSPSPSAADSADSSSRLLDGRAAEPAARAPSKDTAVDIWLLAARYRPAQQQQQQQQQQHNAHVQLQWGQSEPPQPVVHNSLYALSLYDGSNPARQAGLARNRRARRSRELLHYWCADTNTHRRNLPAKAPISRSIRLRMRSCARRSSVCTFSIFHAHRPPQECRMLKNLMNAISAVDRSL